ncbi:hypothetical protein [Bacteroides congonensis]
MKHTGTYLSLLFLLFFASCQTSEEQEETPNNGGTAPNNQILVEQADFTTSVMDRVKQFHVTTHSTNSNQNGIYVYSQTINKYLNAPEKLASRIILLGFNEVYVSTPKSTLSTINSSNFQWMRTFISFLHSHNIKVFALLLSNPQLYIDQDLLYEDLGNLELYNQTVYSTEKLDGIMADLEPHTLKSGAEQVPEGLDIYWDSNHHYGIGKENDLLLKRTLTILQRASFNLSPLNLKESVSFLYQPKYNEGQLSYGSTTQFLQHCESVHVMAYYNRAEVIWNRSLPLLGNADKLYKNAVSICVKVSVNTYGDEGNENTSLQPNGWKYLIETLSDIYNQGKQHPSFRGMDFFEYNGLEIMLENMLN